MDGASETEFSTYLIIQEPTGERHVSLDEGRTWRIGRTAESAVVLPDELVSRNHGMIQLTDSRAYYLIDLGSVNGSYVNGARVSIPRSLKDGDLIKIGDTVLVFRHVGGGTVETAITKAPPYGATRVQYIPRLISVLVVDIRDFTKLTQRVDQSVLCQAVGTWFRRGGGIMQARGSWAIKYIGDAIMAVWLHQQKGQEQREILGVLSAYVELSAASATLATEFSLPGVLRIGAGINTGMASVGNAGGSGVEDFTAMGDAVNAAFRIESATKETGVDVAIGGSTCISLQQSFQPERYFKQYRVKLKGYDGSTEVWGATLEAAQRFLDDNKVALDSKRDSK